jgi:hypothetical protein
MQPVRLNHGKRLQCPGYLKWWLVRLDVLLHKPNTAGNGSAEAEGFEVSNNNLFVERRDQGDYAVRRPNAERASAVLPTQSEAIERARQLNRDAAVHVERVRHTNRGGPDRWRKP